MNITTIIELEIQEVEDLAGAELVFTQQQIDDHIMEDCVEYFQLNNSAKTIGLDDGMEKVFHRLKEKGIIPAKTDDFSYEMPVCGSVITEESNEMEIPQKVFISFLS